MRVLLVNHEFSMSGAAVNLLKIADHLTRSGHECAVFPGRPSTGPIEAEYARRGIPILQRAAFPEFAAVICNTIHAGPLVTMAAPHARTIWWLRESESGLEYLLARPSIATAFREASIIVVQHEHQRDNVYRSFLYPRDPATVFVVPNGFRIARAGPTAAKMRPIRVIAVGSVYPLKRQGDLIRAIERLGRPDIECLIIGNQIQLDEEAQRIAQAAPDQYRLLGQLSFDETLTWLRSSDICCLPSRSESQSNILFEAALTGNALVATDLPSFRGIWKNGENALLHPIGDVEALAHAIARLADDVPLRRHLADAAAVTASEFTEERLFANVDRVLAAACA
ncbi:MAG TPA: glycosyltransferase family 4 protein [Stellaceae bacterium]|nr:glycosyltransferase family 4 protein [Stellaceae bacterium]